jgi:small-conductance mechanosensitive channel
MNPSEILATVTQSVFDKPVIHYSNINISVSEIIFIGAIFVIAYFCHVAFKILMAIQVKRNRIKRAQSKTLSQLAGYIITIVAIAVAFSYVGYSLTYFLLGSTALLVGLGFGLQQLFVDLIAGVILLLDKNINYGDVLRVDIPGVTNMQGRIIQIGLRATLLETIDNERVILPNSKVLSNSIKSLMRGNGAARFRVQVPVSFEQDMDLAKKLMTQAVLENEKVDKELQPTIIIKSFEENSIILEIRFWMKELFNSENILSDIRFEILKKFNKNEVSIPYPRRVIHEKNDKPSDKTVVI